MTQQPTIAVVPSDAVIELQISGGPVGPPGPPNAGVYLKGVIAAWPPAASPDVGDLYVMPDPPIAGAPAWAIAGHGAFWDGTSWVDAGHLKGPQGNQGIPGPPLNIKGTAFSWVPDSNAKPGDLWILPDPLPMGTPAGFKAGGAAAWDDVAKKWIALEAIRGPAGHSITVYGPSPVPPPTAEKGDIWLASDPSLFSATFDPSGITPIPGPAGPAGVAGPSAFEAWKIAAARPTASLQDFIDAIRGAAGSVGPKGDPGETLKVNGVVATAGDLPTTPPLLTVNVTSDDGHLWVYDPSSAAANANGWNDLGKISGPAGASAFISASVASVTALPAKGAAGQMIFVTDVGHLYGWDDTTGAWVDGGKISDGSLDDGTAQGQMLVWDGTAKRWSAADVLRLVAGTADGDVPLWDVATSAYLSGRPQLKNLGDVLMPPDMTKADTWTIEWSDALKKFTLVPHVQKAELDRVELEALQAVMRNGMIRDTLPQPPHGPVMSGTVFLVGENPTGAWAGQANKLAIHDVNGKWVFEPAQTGNTHYHDKLKTFVSWNGTAWVPIAAAAASGITQWSSDAHKAGAVVLWNGNLYQASTDIARGSGAPGVSGPTLLLLVGNGVAAGSTVTVNIAPQGGTPGALQYVAVAGDTDAATLAAHLAEALTADPGMAAIGIYQASGSVVYAVGRGVQLTATPATPIGVATASTTNAWRELSAGEISRLQDVALTPLADGQLLTYDLASKRWVNRSPNVQLAIDAYTKAEIDSRLSALVGGIAHGVPVDSISATPPSSPQEGHEYIIAPGATGAWAGHVNKVAIWHNNAWQFVDPHTGDTHLVEDQQAQYTWNGTAWVKVSSATGGSDRSGVGEIISWLGDTFPAADYVECKGQVVAVSNYPDLHAVIGNKYNTGTPADGTTTFALPDLRGHFLRGDSATLAVGAKKDWTTARPRTNFTTDTQGNHTHTADTQGNHNHSFQRGGANFSGDIKYQDQTFSPINVHGGGNTIWAGINANGAHSHNISAAGAHAHTVTGGGDAETAPAHVVVKWLIRHRAIVTGGTGPKGDSLKMMTLSQADYDAIVSKDPLTMYVIV